MISVFAGVLAALAMPADGWAQASQPPQQRPQDARDLAKKSQNPIADLISLPLQNNTYFGIGPSDKTANVLNIQPVVPVGLGDWNVINRAILPVIYLPDLASGLDVLPEGLPSGSKFGLGDLNYTAFFLPKTTSDFTWGIGPSITFPRQRIARSAPRNGASGHRRSRSSRRGHGWSAYSRAGRVAQTVELVAAELTLARRLAGAAAVL